MKKRKQPKESVYTVEQAEYSVYRDPTSYRPDLSPYARPGWEPHYTNGLPGYPMRWVPVRGRK